uniref:trypsin n=1 Tax=Culex tarsalis TaxID=7177 RepID=A0A1Q3FQJ5_CULTA
MKLLLTLAFVAVVVGSCKGAPGTVGRIVGGQDTTIENHPYQVSLRRRGNHNCGGAILNENTILTAAHCVYYTDSPPSDYSIRAGSTLRNQGGQLITASEVFIHPWYDDWTLDWDIAILKLEQNLVLGPSVQKIDLPETTFKIQHGTLASIAGWGTLYYQGPSTNHLQQVSVPIVDNVICSKAYQNFGSILSFHLCAGDAGLDACQGDSGGPLVYGGQVIGIVSWGYGCAFKGYPTVYTRVSDFIEFIHEHM